MKEGMIKNKVLDEIISLMGEKEVEMLKGKKKPAIISAEITTATPMKKEEMEDMGEEKMSEESESPEMEVENLDPEMIKKILKSLK